MRLPPEEEEEEEEEDPPVARRWRHQQVPLGCCCRRAFGRRRRSELRQTLHVFLPPEVLVAEATAGGEGGGLPHPLAFRFWV